MTTQYQHMPPPAPQKPRKRGRLVFAFVMVALGMISAVALLAAMGSSHRTTSEYRASTAANPPTSVAQAPIGTVAETPAPVAPSGPAAEFGEGQFEVGVDIVAGKYRTAGPEANIMDMCYVERSRNASGEFGSIIANDIVKGPHTIAVKNGEFVTNSGCKSFVKIG